MKIKLIRPWENLGRHWATDQLLEVDDRGAEQLIKDGIAVLYVPNPDDLLLSSNMSDEESTQAIEQEVRRQLGIGKTSNRVPPFVGRSAVSGFGPMEPKEFWMGKGYGGGRSSRFDDAADFLKAVALASKGKWDARLKDISEGVSAEGGFLVPDEMANFVWSEILEDSPFFTQATLLPMSGSSIKVPFVADADRSATGIHGISTPVGVAEASALTDISPTFGQCELTLKKIGGRCRVSNEMLEDSRQAMSVLLPQLFADALSWTMIKQFINGSGANECLGIMNSPALVTQGKEDGQPATTIVYDNVIKMWSRMLPKARKTAVWLISPSAEVAVRTLSIAVGTGGSSAFVLNAASQLPETIFGRPVFFSEHCQTLGTTGDIICFNPRAYAIGKKPGEQIRIEVSTHARFETDQTVFRAIARLDGQSLTANPVTPASSGLTLSHFVALETRD